MTRRGLVATAIPYFAFFTWYHIFSYDVLKFIVDKSTITFSICNASFNFLVSFGLILSSFFVRRIGKTSVIYSWSTLSSIGTILIILAPSDAFRLAIYFLLGIVFGVGLLAFFTFFWDLTIQEERGRVAGLIGSVLLPIFSLIYVSVNNLHFFTTAVLCFILSLGTLTIKSLNPKKTTILTGKTNQKGYTPERRTIIAYLIPWVIFSSINVSLAKTVSFRILLYFSTSCSILLWIVQVIAASLGAIIGGVIADFFGRRPSLAFGLSLYGVCTALSGLAKTYEMFLIVFINNGVTWGILLVLYSFVIWGDLATKETCAHRYSIGLAIFYSAAAVGTLFSSELLQIPLMVATVASCLLIFLSNIPLFLAPELLPPDSREKIRLKLYIYLAGKKKLKYSSNHG